MVRYSMMLVFLVMLSFFGHTQSFDKSENEFFYEFSPPPTIWLTQEERAILSTKAKMLASDIRKLIIKHANDALTYKPNPPDSIFYEGLVSNHPRRLAMQPHFQDLINLSHLIPAFLLTHKDVYASQTKRILLAWARKYTPTGNDVNENKLRDFFYAYDIHRGNFSEGEKEIIEDWLNDMALKQIALWDIKFGSSNRHAKRMKLILMAGITLNNQEYLDFAIEEIEKILDGSLRDLERRDAFHYHNSQVKNYLMLNYLTRLVGEDIYRNIQAQGGSIKKSMHFMFPYIRRERIHPEWVNSKIGLDRRRVEAGDEFYRPGKPWDIREGYKSIILASPFDPECEALIAKLEQQENLEDLR